ncbi:sodium:solute symporter family protein [Croceitalea rosinachiae]|uniref:Sodium/proline symporter n=1 Tax=Croceitalea rosinachiae TaxID=3075596 RepID=A0ABU3ACT8_9FLAO|nr:sodium/proline symporter [Croceitalea sp. F388]MDT0608005.1 sodium/proline symporter [Croceitalea sp. F388]
MLDVLDRTEMIDLQFIIFVGYFLLIFGIGWLSLRWTKSEEDYWIAGSKLGWGIGGATMAATHTSAGTFIGTIGVIYAVGWSFGWVLITIPLAYWFMVAVLAPRFTAVKELTLPAFLERRYQSKTARGIGGVIILIATVVYIQAQILAGGLVANVVFGISPLTGMIIFTLILLLYTLVGGMLAVVYTDFLQMLIMIVGTVVSVPLALIHFDGMAALMEKVELIKPLTFEWSGFPTVLLIGLGLAFFLGSVATPEKVVRLYAMKDMKSIRRGILLAVIVVTGINLLVFILGLVAMVLFPNLPTGDLAMPMIAKTVLPTFVGTIMLAAVTSAMMSTVDSLLLVAGSALSEDIYQNLIRKKASKSRRLFVARVGILIVGIIPLISIISGFAEGELIQFIVILFTAIMAAGFFTPVVGGVLWKRATKQGAIAAMVGGVLVTGLWKAFGNELIYPVIPGFLVSVLSYIVVSLFTERPPESAWKPYFEKNSNTKKIKE